MNKLYFLLLSYIVAQGSVNAMVTYPLHDAALRGKVELVRFLLDSGHDVNEQNNFGSTPIGGAVWQDFSEVVRLLLGRGFGRTQLDYAVIYDHQEIAQMIREHIIAHRRQPILTLTLAMHPRLGELSPARILPFDGLVQKAIFGYLTDSQ